MAEPTHSIRVRYGEVDQQGVVFNAHWLAYADDAVTRFFDQLGYEPATLWSGGEDAPWDLMVRRSGIDFAGAARFDEVVDLHVHASRLGTSSFDLTIVATVADRPTVTVVSTYVCVVPVRLVPKPLPDELRARLSATVPEPAA